MPCLWPARCIKLTLQGLLDELQHRPGAEPGDEGLLVNASDFTIEDVGIEDTHGDAMKVNEGSNIVIRRVRTEWTNGPDEKNGAYGIYPVQAENVLVEECVAIAASDAGIYVGQCQHAIVRNNMRQPEVTEEEVREERPEPGRPLETLTPGMAVRVGSLWRVGELIDLPDGKGRGRVAVRQNPHGQAAVQAHQVAVGALVV